MQSNATPPKKTATGLDENLAGLLCYVGWWVSGIVFLIIEPENKFIRFHAIQSIVVFGFITIAVSILSWIPVVGAFLGAIIGLIGVAIWVAMMFKAQQGAKYKLPVAGDMAERYSEPKKQ
jgi:uncharacterized membrane protein